MKDLKRLFHGGLAFRCKDCYIIPNRFTDEQRALFLNSPLVLDRMYGGASITLELVTEATYISFRYKFYTQTKWISSFEVYTNGSLTHLVEENKLEPEGQMEFFFSEGKKRIEIYLPNGTETGIKDFFVNGEYAVIPKKRMKVLFIGDSITQGFGSQRSSQTYVNVVKRALNYEIINQGIGGHYCDKNLVKEIPFKPDKIIVAYGTNHRDWSQEANEEAIEGFFKKLSGLYKERKTLVILPPYYGREQTEEVRQKYKRIKEIFVSAVSKYPNMQIVSAFEMIPHFIGYYMEDFVHPNALGMEVYGNSLVKAIKNRKF